MMMMIIIQEKAICKFAGMTQCPDEFRNLSECVMKILTACRMLQILIARCQERGRCVFFAFQPIAQMQFLDALASLRPMIKI